MEAQETENKRKYKRLAVNDGIALTPKGVCQLANLNADGISFKCTKEGSFPGEWQMDIYDSRGLSLENVKVKKVWEKGLRNAISTSPFSTEIGGEFKNLTDEQAEKLITYLQHLTETEK